MADHPGLTPQEEEVMNHLKDAWNAFVELPHPIPIEGEEFTRHIHQAQYMIGARMAARVDPQIWTPRG